MAIESAQAKQQRAPASQKAVETKQLSLGLAGEWFVLPKFIDNWDVSKYTKIDLQWVRCFSVKKDRKAVLPIAYLASLWSPNILLMQLFTGFHISYTFRLLLQIFHKCIFQLHWTSTKIVLCRVIECPKLGTTPQKIMLYEPHEQSHSVLVYPEDSRLQTWNAKKYNA